MLRLIASILFIGYFANPLPTFAEEGIPFEEKGYDLEHIIKAGHLFFGRITGTLAKTVEKSYSVLGKPNAYILGEEGGFAALAGVTYGEGKLNFLNGGSHKIFWQGVSFGPDLGLQGSRIMILVYDLKDLDHFWGRYGGFSANAFQLAGAGLSALYHKKVLLIPVRSGVGARWGLNFNYLKFTSAPTWNPF